MIIDTHAHYDSSRYNDDRHEIITALPQNGVEKIINIGCDLKTSRAAVALAAKYPHVFATVGAHPHYVKSLGDIAGTTSSLGDGFRSAGKNKAVNELIALAENKKVVGFGEIGLDFFHNHSPQDMQREWFAHLLKIVAELDLPAIIHSRDANSEVFEMIKASDVRRGVIHAFSGDAELARAYVDMGFHIGIGGVVTFKKSDTLQDAVAAVPLEKILLETDCPYLAPEPFRGQRNESAYLTYVAEKIAKIKGTNADTVCAVTSENARGLFGI